MSIWSRPLTRPNDEFKSANNRGGINGWTGFDRVYGIAVSVAGTERPGARAKVVERDT